MSCPSYHSGEVISLGVRLAMNIRTSLPTLAAITMVRVFSTLALIVGDPIPGHSQGFAWPVTWSLRPMFEVIEGLPLGALDPSWRRAALIRPHDLPIASTRPGEGLEDYGMRLSAEADLDGDRRADRAVVGVFETDQGELGRFLLILSRSGPASPWHKRALFQVPGGSTFSAIALRDTVLTWYGCLECDDQCAVIHVGEELRLRCQGQGG